MVRYYVYMIVGKKKNRTFSYIGYTSNLKQRINLHNSSKGAKFTRGGRWVLAYSKFYYSKIKAMKEEFALKNNKSKRILIKKKFLN